MARHFDYTSLFLFNSVIDCGNIAQASKVNNIAASAISKRILDLEYRLRVQLIHRHRDGISPTAAGKALYMHIKNISQSMKHLEADISKYSIGRKGRVKLWANSSAVTEFLPEDIKEFIDKYADISIDLREETSEKVVEAIKNGDTDIGIFSNHCNTLDINKRIYRKDTLVVIVPHGHPLASHKKVTIKDTVNFDHIGMQIGSSLLKQISEATHQQGLNINFKIKVLSFDGVLRMVEAGLGISIVPLGVIEPYLEETTFVVIPLCEDWAERTLFVGYRDYKELPLSAKYLLDELSPCHD